MTDGVIDNRHFYNALKETYKKYLTYGSRSPEKLKPIHGWMGETYKRILGDHYEVFYLNGSEFVVNGRYYPKTVDIAISLKDKEPKFVISFKFVTSNYKQNVNNFFENLLGECANIRTEKIGFGHIMILRDKIPYFAKKGEIEKWEYPDDKNLGKYVKLFKDRKEFFHAPNFLCLEILSINPIIEEAYNRGPGSGGYEFNEDLKQKFTELQFANGIDNLKKLTVNKDIIKKGMTINKFFEETLAYIQNRPPKK